MHSWSLIVDASSPTPQVELPDMEAQLRASLENPAVSIADPAAWHEAFGDSIATDSGQNVTHSKALTLSTFWAAVKMISGDVSRLPLGTFRRRPGGLRPVVDESHQLWPFIQPLGMANEELSTLKLFRRAMVHALTYENAYIWMDWSTAGRLRGLYNLLPDRTTVGRHRGKLYCVTEVGDDATGGARLMVRPYEEIIHIEGLCIDGLVGCDTVVKAREDIGVALAARQFKSKFFGQGMHAGGILQAPPGAPSKAIKRVENAIDQTFSGSAKAFKTLVLRDNFKWHSTQVSPEQAQMVEMDESEIRNLCRRFMLQPGRMGLRDSVSYNSLEAEKRDYHDTTLSYWLSVIRSEINAKALTADERREWLVDYNVSLALLWADASTLITVATQGVNARDSAGQSIFSADEARAMFGLPQRDEDELTDTEEDDSDADDMEDEDDSEPADDAMPDDSRAAFVRLVAEDLRRTVRRLNQRAGRLVARPHELREWLGQLTSGEAKDMAVAVATLEPCLAACRAVGLVPSDITAEAVAGAVMRQYAESMATAASSEMEAIALPLADSAAAQYIGGHRSGNEQSPGAAGDQSRAVAAASQ